VTLVWSQAAAYLQLALSIDRHLPGFVDAYFGPAEHRRAVGERAKPPLRRSYGFTYPLGEDLVRRFVFGGADPPLKRFARLLEEPATLDQVAEWIGSQAPRD
jgi:hypothetical protein